MFDTKTNVLCSQSQMFEFMCNMLFFRFREKKYLIGQMAEQFVLNYVICQGGFELSRLRLWFSG